MERVTRAEILPSRDGLPGISVRVTYARSSGGYVAMPTASGRTEMVWQPFSEERTEVKTFADRQSLEIFLSAWGLIDQADLEVR